LQVTGRIKVWNNGSGVPVEIHKNEGVYVPELIFGHLLTSSNYEDDQKKVSTHGAGSDERTDASSALYRARLIYR
jgi:DNA gyrase/topoisomerase IV subunit B